eukprot:m51a1_g7823 hypothetical protein (852) ;mRNA; r:139405-142623
MDTCMEFVKMFIELRHRFKKQKMILKMDGPLGGSSKKRNGLVQAFLYYKYIVSDHDKEIHEILVGIKRAIPISAPENPKDLTNLDATLDKFLMKLGENPPKWANALLVDASAIRTSIQGLRGSLGEAHKQVTDKLQSIDTTLSQQGTALGVIAQTASSTNTGLAQLWDALNKWAAGEGSSKAIASIQASIDRFASSMNMLGRAEFTTIKGLLGDIKRREIPVDTSAITKHITKLQRQNENAARDIMGIMSKSMMSTLGTRFDNLKEYFEGHRTVDEANRAKVQKNLNELIQRVKALQVEALSPADSEVDHIQAIVDNLAEQKRLSKKYESEMEKVNGAIQAMKEELQKLPKTHDTTELDKLIKRLKNATGATEEQKRMISGIITDLRSLGIKSQAEKLEAQVKALTKVSDSLTSAPKNIKEALSESSAAMTRVSTKLETTTAGMESLTQKADFTLETMKKTLKNAPDMQVYTENLEKLGNLFSQGEAQRKAMDKVMEQLKKNSSPEAVKQVADTLNQNLITNFRGKLTITETIKSVKDALSRISSLAEWKSMKTAIASAENKYDTINRSISSLEKDIKNQKWNSPSFTNLKKEFLNLRNTLDNFKTSSEIEQAISVWKDGTRSLERLLKDAKKQLEKTGEVTESTRKSIDSVVKDLKDMFSRISDDMKLVIEQVKEVQESIKTTKEDMESSIGRVQKNISKSTATMQKSFDDGMQKLGSTQMKIDVLLKESGNVYGSVNALVERYRQAADNIGQRESLSAKLQEKEDHIISLLEAQVKLKLQNEKEIGKLKTELETLSREKDSKVSKAEKDIIAEQYKSIFECMTTLSNHATLMQQEMAKLGELRNTIASL